MSQETQDQNTEQTAPPVAPSLTLTDLSAMRQIIEVASSRGTFKPEEMQVVGTVYQKLTAFLVAATPPAPQVEAETTTEGITQ